MTHESVDLFAGASGWGVAARRLGVVEPVGVEREKWPTLTSRAAGFQVIQGDVRELDPREVLRDRGRLGGSPPCPTFSQASLKKEGAEVLAALVRALHLVAAGTRPEEAVAAVHDRRLDERSVLVLEPMRWVREARPVSVTLEQVPGVLPVWEAYAALLREWGYSAWAGILSAEEFGLGQVRERAVLIASRGREVSRPRATHSRFHRYSRHRLDPGVPPWVTMAEALGPGFVPVAANAGTTPEMMAWAYARPSPAMVGSFAAQVVAAPGYRRPGDPPRQKTPGSVRITLAQAAHLQGFPPDHPWQGPETAQWLQVGNAIPVALAEAVLREVHGLTA